MIAGREIDVHRFLWTKMREKWSQLPLENRNIRHFSHMRDLHEDAKH